MRKTLASKDIGFRDIPTKGSLRYGHLLNNPVDLWKILRATKAVPILSDI